MLPKPRQLMTNPAYTPLLNICDGVLLTSSEVAKHWRYTLQHLHNMRARQRGPAFVKIEGRVRYRLSEIMRFEIHGQGGPWTPDRVSLALATMRDLAPEMREKIGAHLSAVLDAE